MNPTNKPQTLSANLNDAADLAEQRAADAIRDGAPELAALIQRNAAHMRRLAYNHATAATYQQDDTLNPEQIS